MFNLMIQACMAIHAANSRNKDFRDRERSLGGNSTLVSPVARHQDVTIHSPSCAPAIIVQGGIKDMHAEYISKKAPVLYTPVFHPATGSSITNNQYGMIQSCLRAARFIVHTTTV